jgi:uncharacterized protein
MTNPLPLANLITLGARDFAALRDFYRRVGWPQVMDDGEFAVFELRGIVLALFPLAKLARDGNTEPEASSGGIRFTIGVQVDSAEEVDRLTEHMGMAGARVTKEPVDAEFFTGRWRICATPRAITSRSSGPTCPTVPSSSRLGGPPVCSRMRSYEQPRRAPRALLDRSRTSRPLLVVPSGARDGVPVNRHVP